MGRVKMKTSKSGIDLIKSFEGLRLEKYLDCIGVPTIGYGHTGKDIEKISKISVEDAEVLLIKDLKKFETYVNKFNEIYNFTQNEFDALVSFAFNCGNNNLKKLVKDGARTKKEIAESFIKYNKASGKVVEGLTERRKKESTLFNSFEAVKQYYPKYSGASNSISDILNSMHIDFSFTNRKRIAIANNIPNYKGTYAQNIELVKLVKNGKLVRC